MRKAMPGRRRSSGGGPRSGRGGSSAARSAPGPAPEAAGGLGAPDPTDSRRRRLSGASVGGRAHRPVLRSSAAGACAGRGGGLGARPGRRWACPQGREGRQLPPSAKPVARARTWRLNLPDGTTREGAHDAWEGAMAQARLQDPTAPWRQDPTTPKQIAWLTAHRIRVREGPTKGEAADRMSRIMGRSS